MDAIVLLCRWRDWSTVINVDVMIPQLPERADMVANTVRVLQIFHLLVAFFWLAPVCDFRRDAKVGAGGLDAAVPTGTVIGLFDDADKDGCIVDYSIDDEDVQVLLGKVFQLCE